MFATYIKITNSQNALFGNNAIVGSSFSNRLIGTVLIVDFVAKFCASVRGECIMKNVGHFLDFISVMVTFSEYLKCYEGIYLHGLENSAKIWSAKPTSLRIGKYLGLF